MFIFKLFQSLMLKSRHKIPLSEQLKNPIGKSYIGNLDPPSTQVFRCNIIDSPDVTLDITKDFKISKR
jgi:hypothetical protein